MKEHSYQDKGIQATPKHKTCSCRGRKDQGKEGSRTLQAMIPGKRKRAEDNSAHEKNFGEDLGPKCSGMKRRKGKMSPGMQRAQGDV